MLDRLISSDTSMVIATGGSIVADATSFARLLAHCRTVWIRATSEEHMARVVAQGDLRPMKDNHQAMSDLRAILESREDLYKKADLTLVTSNRTLQQSLQDLIRSLV